MMISNTNKALRRFGFVALSVTVLLGCTDEDPEPPPPLEPAPAFRWVGWLPKQLGDVYEEPCPAPTSDAALWTVRRLFSPLAALGELGLLDANDNPTETGKKLIDDVGTPDGQGGVYCLYEWPWPGVDAPTSEALFATLPDEFDTDTPVTAVGKPQPDPPIVVALASTRAELVQEVSATLAAHAQTQHGGLDQVPPADRRVEVAVLDSALPHAAGLAMPGTGQLAHGRDMALGIRALACPGNEAVGSGCNVGVHNELALDLEPDGNGGARLNRVEGGFFGTPATLAAMTWMATLRWKAHHPLSRFVLNYSVGWEEQPGAEPDVPAVESMRLALLLARCLGALPIAAAGNDRNGDPPGSGPMFPAGWEDDDEPPRCLQQNAPLIYSVGGVDGLLQPIATTPSGGMPPLAAYALSVPADTRYMTASTTAPPLYESPPLTGTSLAAVAASSVAALVWSHFPDLTATEVMEIIYDSGTKTGLTADYCAGPNSSCPSVHRLSLCDALAHALAQAGGQLTCAPIPQVNPTWTLSQQSDAAQISVPYTVGQLAMLPVSQSCRPGDQLLSEQDPTQVDHPCPDAEMYNAIVAPQVGPQPGQPDCTVCGYHRNSPGTLIMDTREPPPAPPQDPAAGTIDSVRLKLTAANGSHVYIDLDPYYVPNQLVVVENLVLPPTFVPQMAELVAIVRGYNGQQQSRSQQIALGL